jgi:hypothetical protein
MAVVTRVRAASMDASTGAFAPQITGLYAGEALDAAAPCYIKTSDGKVYMSNGTAANEAAEFVGMTPHSRLAGEAVTLFGLGARFRYGSGLSPGQLLYIFTTAGTLGDAATTGGVNPIARVITDTDIVIIRASE